MKPCCTCKKTAPEVTFSKNSKRCKACQREYHKAWHKKNADSVIKKVTQWGKENPERKRAHAKATRERHGDAYRLVAKTWRENNRERMAELKRAWLDDNPEKVFEYNHRRRAGGGNVTARIARELKLEQPTCLACNSPDNLTIDHVVPLSRGGSNDKENLQVLCMTCNLSKGVKSTDYRNKGTIDQAFSHYKQFVEYV